MPSDDRGRPRAARPVVDRPARRRRRDRRDRRRLGALRGDPERRRPHPAAADPRRAVAVPALRAHPQGPQDDRVQGRALRPRHRAQGSRGDPRLRRGPRASVRRPQALLRRAGEVRRRPRQDLPDQGAGRAQARAAAPPRADARDRRGLGGHLPVAVHAAPLRADRGQGRVLRGRIRHPRSRRDLRGLDAGGIQAQRDDRGDRRGGRGPRGPGAAERPAEALRPRHQPDLAAQPLRAASGPGRCRRWSRATTSTSPIPIAAG